MINRFFVLSERGEVLIERGFRGGAPRGETETFFRKVQCGEPPIFAFEGVVYAFVKRGALLIGCSAPPNAPPSLLLESLDRFAAFARDFLGALSEETLRANVALGYEIVDALFEFGHFRFQNAAEVFAEMLSAPKGVASAPRRFSLFAASETSAAAAATPTLGAARNEVFVDVIERFSARFEGGALRASDVDGVVRLKSYLSAAPTLRISLSTAALCDARFGAEVSAAEFDAARRLTIAAPRGEFIAMQYRARGAAPPIALSATASESDGTLRVELRIAFELSDGSQAKGVVARFPLSDVAAVRFDALSEGQNAVYVEAERVVEWRVGTFDGGAATLVARAAVGGRRYSLGAAQLRFEIAQSDASLVRVRSLQIDGAAKVSKWIRYSTIANFYSAAFELLTR